MSPSETQRISRRAALRLLAAGAGSALLAACGGSAAPQALDLQDVSPAPADPTEPPSTATAAPLAEATAAPANTSIPTSLVDTSNTLTIWHYDDRLQLVAQGFEQANPGVKVDIKSYWADGPYFPRLRNALKDGKGAPDLAMLDLGELAELVAIGGLADLAAAPFDGSKLQNDMVASLWNPALFDGKLHALPWSINPGSLWYRADVLKEAGLASEPEQFQARVQTWEDLFALGQELQEKKPGLTLLPDATEIFWTVVAQQALGWFDGNRVLIRQKGVRAATIAAKARKLKLDANTEVNDFSALLRQGLAVGWLFWPGAQPLLKEFAPEAVGHWRVVAVPEGPLLWGGSLLALPEQGQKQELAWKLAQYLCATAGAQNASFKATGALPAFKPAWGDALYDQPVEFFGGQAVYRDWTKAAEQAPAGAFSPHEREANEAVTNELKQVLFYDADPEQAMASAEAEVLRKVPDAIAG
jgi:multiple sugar transport system substrate-binding protein